MASREDILSLQERVARAIATLAEMKKTPQAMAGDSWVYYRRMIAPDWDHEAHGITSPSYSKLYKVTYEVAHPETGFALPFVEVEWDTPAQNMSYNWAPVRDDPYSWWLQVKHVNYNSDSAGINIRFNIFSPQSGTITVTEIV
jgi:hypothetical protein